MATLKTASREQRDETLRSRHILIFAVFLLAIGILAIAQWYNRLPFGTSLSNDTISEPLIEADKAILEMDLGAAHLQLWAGSTEQMLEGQVQSLTGVETFERTTRAEDGAMVYRLLSDAPNAIREPERWPKWTLQVNPELPLELSVHGGMGESTLDLSRLNLRKVVLEPETARYTVNFPESGQVDAVVEGGTSRTTLIIPANVALKAILNVQGAGHIELDERVYHRDTTYTSPAYGAANDRLDLVVTSNLAHVAIERR